MAKAFLHYTAGVPLDDFVLLVREPLYRMGYTIIHLEEIDFEDRYFTKDDIFIGSIDLTKSFFERVGIQCPEPLGFPDIGDYYGRTIEKTTMSEIRKRTNFPFFIKPSESVKLFTGQLLEKPSHLEFFNDIDGDTELYVQGNIGDILSEYRITVYNNKPIDIRNYNGCPFVFPSNNLINELKEIISKLKDFPISYTIDIAIFKNDEFKIIEFNDFWAIGSYGMNQKKYTTALHRRWQQIMGIELPKEEILSFGL